MCVRVTGSQGATGKAITNVISVGIGGSYLGPEFVYEALRKGTRTLCAPLFVDGSVYSHRVGRVCLLGVTESLSVCVRFVSCVCLCV